MLLNEPVVVLHAASAEKPQKEKWDRQIGNLDRTSGGRKSW